MNDDAVSTVSPHSAFLLLDPIMKRVLHPGHRYWFAVDNAWLIARRFGSRN